MLTLDALAAFADNYIWTLADPQGRALIVDPGDAAPVFAAVERGLQPVAILLTHHHDDHIGGVGALCSALRIPCYAPDDARIDLATHRVADGDTVAINELACRLDVMAVPGHTRSHVAYLERGEADAAAAPVLFCGDTLFSLGCGRLFEGTPMQMLDALTRLAALPGDTLVCGGHEYTLANARFALAVEPDNPDLRARAAAAEGQRSAGQRTLPSRMDEERRCNPFLRVDQPSVIAAVRHRLGRAPSNRIETFATLRRWKDEFRA